MRREFFHMLNWENLRYLGALAKGGSFSAAARMLGVEHATISRRVAALESELGIHVVDRRGRKLFLTTEGVRLARIAERMEHEAMAAERLAASSHREISGKITLSAPPAYSAAVLVTPLARLQAEYPQLTLEVIAESRKASLDRREADIAIRLDRPEQDDLSIVRLGTVTFAAYASPGYLSATDPNDWSFIGYADEVMRETPLAQYLLTLAAGRPVRFLANTLELHRCAARAGVGIALLPDFLVDADPTLAIADEDTAPLCRDIWLVVHVDVRDAPAVRAVIDALKEAFGLPRLKSGDQ